MARAAANLIAAALQAYQRELAPRETISASPRNHPETRPVAARRIKDGDANMLVLMNLIWRQLAYTMLIGMRSKLVRL